MSAWAEDSPPPAVVGRAAEHERVSGLLDSARLVTLTGAAGVGKSVLARAVLDERTARHDGTVIRVGCWDGIAEGGPDRRTGPGGRSAGHGTRHRPAYGTPLRDGARPRPGGRHHRRVRTADRR
ncbi:hypothetical protein [Streptomyces sp. NPDC101393]|uniref:hypothetical protein n=1 Tax=Streptomyces sp. NPDC101393 TaxID=3366141 RepID=UPI00380BE0CC